MLRDGLLDVAITFAYPGDRSDPHRETEAAVDTVPLFTESVVIALPASHPLAGSAGGRPRPARGRQLDRRMPALPRPPARRLRGRRGRAADRARDRQRPRRAAPGRRRARSRAAPRLALATLGVPPGVVIRPTIPSSDRSIQVVTQAGARRVPSIAIVLRELLELETGDWGLNPVG